MKSTKLNFLFFIVTSSIFAANSKIYSTFQYERSIKNNPTFIESLNSEEGHASLHLSRFQSFFARQKREATANLKSYKFDLGNDTTHNQALIHWSGNNSKVIFILTRRKESSPSGKITGSTLWRSVNYGKVYTVQSNFTKGTILKSYYVCPTNKSKVIFIDAYQDSHRVWVSWTEGASYTPYDIPFPLDKIEFHPTQQDWMLGYSKSEPALYSSQDFGKTWTLLQNWVTNDRYFWVTDNHGEGEEDLKKVYMEYRDMNVFPRPVYLIKSCYIPSCDPTPFNEECKELGEIEKESLIVQDNFTFAQKSGAREKLYIAHGPNPFIRPTFPGINSQTDFHIINSSGGTVVVGVNHADGRTNLFFSDAGGAEFTLSLPNVRYFGRKSGDDVVFSVDMVEVKGMAGTYITNVRTPAGLNRTLITFNNGRGWAHLKLPEGSPTSCDYSQCFLNLHIAMSQTKSGYYVPGILSKSSVPGLIIAHGSIGPTVVDSPSQVSVFVSNDAGLTWRVGLKKRHLFIVADHGAMILGVQMIFLKPVNQLSFSNDVGKTWNKFTFSNQSINVDGLLTEPGEYTFHFTLFGHRNYRDHWIIFALDLSPLVNRNCSYPGDYSNWTLPVDEKNNSPCHLGMIQTYERRNKDSGCLVGPEFKRKHSVVVCQCSDADYECAYGYVQLSNGSCSRIRGQNALIDDIGEVIGGEGELVTTAAPPCVDGQQKVSTQFRKIPGDKCSGGLPGKLFKFVPCSVATTTLPQTVHLELLNKTNRAQIGDQLRFSVHDQSSKIQWSVYYQSSPDKPVVPTPIRKNLNANNSDVSLIPSKPGDYEVKVQLEGTGASDTMLVSFWYPIEEVYIYHPPVVEVNTKYNATAVVATKYGMVATSSLVGAVSFEWEAENFGHIKEGSLISIQYNTGGHYNLMVTADNQVSYGTARGKVVVKDYVETLVLPLVSSGTITPLMLTHGWLYDLRSLLTTQIFSIPSIRLILSAQKLVNGHNFHVFIEPRTPLQAKLIFSPYDTNTPSRSDLLKTASTVESMIEKAIVQILLPNNLLIIIGKPYIINDVGETIPYNAGLSAGIIALIVILVLAFVIFAAVIARRYTRDFRWNSYFHMRNPRDIRRSRIVRGRAHDQAPIVDEDEFYDDDADIAAGTIDTATNDGVLQFQS